MPSDSDSSDPGDSEFDSLDGPESEVDFDMAALLAPLIPPAPNIPVAQLNSVSFRFISKSVLT